MRSGRYEEARGVLEQNASLDGRGRVLLASCDSVVEWVQDSLQFTLEKSGVNSGEESNFSPVYYKEGLLFVSDRTDKGGSSRRYEWTGRPYLDLYYARMDKDGKALSVEPIKGDVNGIYHEGPLAVQGDTVLYVTRNNYVRKKVGKSVQDVVNMKIYQLNRKDTLWTGMKDLPFNSNDYSNCHPALSKDGNTMYFSSDRPGGQGGNDLYVVRKSNGAWGAPVNLGAGINTAGNEGFPVVYKDSLLYFSSDGLYGLGGLDVYRSLIRDTTVGTPVNVGYPFNTSYDDFSPAINSDFTEGYLSSNRDASHTEVDRIYRIRFNDLRFTLQGTAVDKRTQSPLEGVQVELTNRKTGKKETVVTGPDGTFFFKLDRESEYSVVGSKDGYFTNTEPVSTIGKRVSEDMYVKLKLELEQIVVNKPIVLENIYYDLDKSDIRADAAQGLDNLVRILQDNPDIRIELGSHTDSRADDKYNDQLSQKRAESAVNYIVSKGISKERITAKGYGERQLVNGCGNKVKCTEEQHQVNRRTEFKVVSIDKK
jgi:peptidoglycan-associated lipoprotein